MLASYVDLPRQRRSANPRRIQKVKPSKRRTLVSLHVARDSPLFAKVATTMTTTTTTTTNTLVNRCATWLEQQFLSKCRSLPLPIIVQAMLLHRHVTPSSLNFFSVTTPSLLLLHSFLSVRFSNRISNSNFYPRKSFFLRQFLRIFNDQIRSKFIIISIGSISLSILFFNPFQFCW